MKEEMTLVSIIIPVYNVEAYLESCLDSVCNQTYSQLEILVIDDESPDRCGQIADDYAGKDDRIKVIHIKNRGAAGARNVGLDHCHGEYVMFVDSDDWVEKHSVETLLRAMKESSGDIVQCQYYDEYKDRPIQHFIEAQEKSFSDQGFIIDMLHHWEDVLIWNKIFSKNVVANIRFEEGHCIDDEFFTYRAVMQASRICIIPDYLYHYRQRLSGVMRTPGKRNQRLLDQLEFVTKRYCPLTKKYPEIKDEILMHLIEVLMHVMRESGPNKDTYRKARQLLRRYGFSVMCLRSISLQEKKSVVAYLLLPHSWLVSEEKTMEKTEYIYYK